jgi:hypothetical protein
MGFLKPWGRLAAREPEQSFVCSLWVKILQQNPIITNARCVLSLIERLFNSFFAVNDMDDGRPSSIVASAPTFHRAHLG